MKKITVSALASAITLSSLNSHAAAALHANKAFIPKGNFYLQAESGYSARKSCQKSLEKYIYTRDPSKCDF